MNLYIVRHAIAVQRGAPSYEDDSQRPLTEKGRSKMKKIAKGLASFGVELDRILSSPYVRARDTAKILANEYGMQKEVVFSDSLIPPGDFESLLREIREKHNVSNLALVGHEPMLSSLAGWLIGSREAQITLKKGGVALLTIDGFQAEPRAVLAWLLTPAILVELSK